MYVHIIYIYIFAPPSRVFQVTRSSHLIWCTGEFIENSTFTGRVSSCFSCKMGIWQPDSLGLYPLYPCFYKMSLPQTIAQLTSNFVDVWVYGGYWAIWPVHDLTSMEASLWTLNEHPHVGENVHLPGSLGTAKTHWSYRMKSHSWRSWWT
jgi:hypothetical protein